MSDSGRVTGLVTAIAAMLLGGCDSAESLFFHPDARIRRTPDQDGLQFEEVAFTSRDGTKLTGWFIPARGEAIATVVHFHGNAQNMTAHYSFVSWLPAHGFNLFVFDYRGYGRSEGSPTPSGVLEDSVAALEHVRERPDVDPRKLIAFGQSLGGANALAAVGMAGSDGMIGVVAESAFASYREIAGDKVPFPARWLIHDDVRPIDVVSSISPVPIVLIHGTADPVVPFRHAKLLFESAADPKDLWTLEGAGHTEALGARRDEYLPRLVERFRQWAGVPPEG